MDKREELGFAWVTLLAFLRISTRAFTQGSMVQAGEVIDGLLQQSNVQVVDPGPGHWPILQKLLLDSQASGNLVTDAHLAALAIEHGAALCTNDRDFTRFRGLKLMNPVEIH
jgi:uncharacterized protein